jgi:hypothetical protein
MGEDYNDRLTRAPAVVRPAPVYYWPMVWSVRSLCIIAVALRLVCGVAAAQEPDRPFTVVVLPTAIRDSMAAIWTETNRNWDWVSTLNTPGELMSAAPTRRYLGCLTGSAIGDTLWVSHLIPATGVKQRESGITGDCSNVVGLIGTWHTHPYRAGFQRRAIKERGLSGLDFKAFAAAADLVTIVMWDADSLDLATKGPAGRVQHPTPYIVR